MSDVEQASPQFSNERLEEIKALIARALTLPSLSYIGEMMPVIAVDAILQAKEFIYSQLAQNLKQDLLRVYHENSQGEYNLLPASMAERFLRNQVFYDKYNFKFDKKLNELV